VTRRVRLAVSMGDPAGIGPEVVIKAITRRAVAARIEPVLVGDPGVWHDTAQRLGARVTFSDGGEGAQPGRVAIAITSQLPAPYRRPGEPRTAKGVAACGDAAYAAILEAVRLVQTGRAQGLVTAPISKAHLVAAGHDFPGHTELLARLAGGVPVRMMMAGSNLRVVLVTTHLRLADVPRRLTRDNVLQTIELTVHALRHQFRVPAPRVAVTGLNPHAGEQGLFGDEEARIITPAIQTARRRGIDASGPHAADSVFAHAAGGGYDAVVCMYHDQGLAPFKLLHFADGVNFTLGLPFVRTSPDHGTAFDIAGTGRADPSSMIAALQLAAHTAASTLRSHGRRASNRGGLVKHA
jgi:4-hydroxythreonine-4-phosphate dehydrogenase